MRYLANAEAWFADALKLKLLDPDEKVRAAVCKVYSQLDYETALHHVSEAQLRAVAGRGVDKKVRYGHCLFETMGQCYLVAPRSYGGPK